mgnify:CR=1 FL=1
MLAAHGVSQPSDMQDRPLVEATLEQTGLSGNVSDSCNDRC